MADMRVERIEIASFKRIENFTIDLESITALVGGNTSGKSSALQAIQLCVSLLQASYEGRRGRNKIHSFSTTLSDDEVSFKPTGNLLDLRHGSRATQTAGFGISLHCSDLGENGVIRNNRVCKVNIKRGKNANLALSVDGDLDLAASLADISQPFSIFTPGLSGIPLREEWRTRGALDAGAMHGDANLYLRSVLDHLLNDDLEVADRERQIRMWREKCAINDLPDSAWKTFCGLLDRCYPGARVYVNHDPRTSRFINSTIAVYDHEMSLDMASTGMLQVIQILAYACFYKPPLLILDEPDAHLHADSQSKLYEALRGLARETNTRILLASHSPQLIQRLTYDTEAAILWMDEGAKVEVGEERKPAIPLLMTLGALHLGADVFDPAKDRILLTEDKVVPAVRALAAANGAGENLAVLSYNGCGNLSGARHLARLLRDIRPEAKVIIHRDRDFRTETEIAFEISVFEEWCQTEKIDGIEEVFTSMNDVEHVFVTIEHLSNRFSPELNEELINQIISGVIAELRDDMTGRIRKARETIANTIYASDRHKKKPAWAAAGMTDKPPRIESFLPDRGTDPLSIAACHGKELARQVLPKLHHVLGGNIDAVKERMYGSSPALEDPRWLAAFA